MNIDPPNRAPGLALFFSSLELACLVIFFWVHPKQRFHLRDLMRRTGRSMASIQDALDRMVGIGALRGEDEGGRTCYVADEGHPSWFAWVLLLRASGSFAEILREALIDADGIEAAFIFGSQARGDTRPDSDVDLFLIGGDEARDRVIRDLLLEAEFLLGKELDVIGSNAEKLAARIQSGNSFVSRVIAEPKLWVRGGPQVLDRAEAVARSETVDRALIT